MRTALKVSVGLNLVLLGCLGLLLAKRSKSAVTDPVAQALSVRGYSPERTSDDLNQFSWSQLESTNYHAYITNLRRVGCPEQTIRDIITADIDGVYAGRREERQSKLTAAGPMPTGSADEDPKAALENLRIEEAGVITALLGSQTPKEQQGKPLMPVRNSRAQLKNRPVSLPVVCYDVDWAALNLDKGRQDAIGELRQDFIDAIGGPKQDPNDPAYRELWQKAQPEIDERLKAMIGTQAFQDYQVQAQPQAHN